MKNMNKTMLFFSVFMLALVMNSCSNIFDLFETESEAKTVVLDQTYSAASITGVSIALVSESLDIVTHTMSDFRVVIKSNLTDEDYYPIVTIMNETFKILDQTRNIPMGKSYDCSVTVYVPEGFIASNSEKGWSIETVSGYIDAQRLSGKVLNLESVSGYITVSSSDTESLNLNTVSGSISISGEADKFEMTSTSGSISINLSAMFTSNASIQTVSGSIDVFLPENDGFIHSFDTVSGSVKNNFTGTQTSGGSGTSTYKTALVSLTTKSPSGSVKVSKK
jgi:hypothetical protein